jgi:hypothetical protein
MAHCEKLVTCPFFANNLPNMPGVAILMRETYCRGDKLACARYMVSKAGLKVPYDLLPNDVETARKILAQAG